MDTCKFRENIACSEECCEDCGWNKDVEKKRIALIRGQKRKGAFIGTAFDGYADGNPVYYEWACSECGCTFEDKEPDYNYCPNCGADMRGK